MEDAIDKLIKAYDLIKKSHRTFKNTNHAAEPVVKNIMVDLNGLLSNLLGEIN